MNKAPITLTAALLTFLVSSCAIVRPGEVAVKQRLGKITKKTVEEGPVFFNPFITKVIKTSVRTENLEVRLSLPSKEGLNVAAEISILYHIEKTKVPELIETLGSDYETIIRSVFRSSSADVCAQFEAKDMHSGNRGVIEEQIREKMQGTLAEKGIIIESVLMKSISLPDGLYSSIEDRLQAEQDALRMQYIIEQEKLEAQRKIIEAEGNRDAQIILSEGLTEEILKLKGIEAFLELAQSTGAKIIVTDGSGNPLIME